MTQLPATALIAPPWESCMSATTENSHPVEVECPSCNHRFRVPLNALSAGVHFPCHGCGGDILIATPALRQLLREIDRDLRTADDLPIVLRPPECRPVAQRGADKEKAQTS